MDKRTLIAIVLSLALVMGYQYLFVKKQVPEQPAATAPSNSTAETTAGPVTEEKSIPESPPALNQPLVKTGDVLAAGKEISVETPLYSAVFTTRGATLTSFKLKNYRQDLAENSPPVELVHLKGDMEYPLSISFPSSSINLDPTVIYETGEEAIDLAGQMNNEKQLVFSKIYPGEVQVDKIYTFRGDAYTFDLTVAITNLSDKILKQSALLSWNEYVDPEEEGSRYVHEGPISFVKDDLETEKVKKLDETKVLGPDVSWGGFETKYFIASVIPQQPSLTNLVISKDRNNVVSVALDGPKNIILPGQSGTFKYTVYLGPKEYETLKAEGVGLENSIDYGSWIKWLALPLLYIMKFINNYIDNYGVAIIILTILVKVLFWPLGNISYRSMKGMQKLQPEITKLREKYKDDKQRLNQEVMGLYKIHKVNPMSGCLPMLIQLPVFFGLYKALLYSIELRHAHFFLWIQDLSAKDPYYITPLVMGATMFLQQKMTPTPGGDDMQQKMMMWMPVVFTFLFLNFPSGLVIYWLFNNILSIGQQHLVNKRMS
jgi:YidC/Oxa1 family membrane protein insertase